MEGVNEQKRTFCSRCVGALDKMPQHYQKYQQKLDIVIFCNSRFRHNYSLKSIVDKHYPALDLAGLFKVLKCLRCVLHFKLFIYKAVVNYHLSRSGIMRYK